MNRLTQFALGLILICGLAQAQGVKTENSLIGERLAGTWLIDEELSKQLDPAYNPEKVFRMVRFVSDEKAAARAPLFAKWLQKETVQFAGMMTYGIDDTVSIREVLLSKDKDGNPQLVQYGVKDGGREDTESNIVQIARAVDPQNDILFLSGDFSSNPTQALRRRK